METITQHRQQPHSTPVAWRQGWQGYYRVAVLSVYAVQAAPDQLVKILTPVSVHLTPTWHTAQIGICNLMYLFLERLRPLLISSCPCVMLQIFIPWLLSFLKEKEVQNLRS